MSFTIFVDGSSNLPRKQLETLSIRVLPCAYTLDGKPGVYEGDVDSFDFHGYYELLRGGAQMKTTLLNTHLFLTHWRPELEKGLDVLYVCMSSGISGTFQAATLAAQELMEEFPERTVRVVDSLGAGFGSGLLACRAADLRAEGRSAGETADTLDAEVPQMLQFFTVDDLNFLKRGGRVSATTAFVGTMLSIKPIMHTSDEGKLVPVGKARGRKAALKALLDSIERLAIRPEEQTMFICHADCEEEARAVARQIKDRFGTKTVHINYIGPVIGSHTGPNTMGIFFIGTKR